MRFVCLFDPRLTWALWNSRIHAHRDAYFFLKKTKNFLYCMHLWVPFTCHVSHWLRFKASQVDKILISLLVAFIVFSLPVTYWGIPVLLGATASTQQRTILLHLGLHSMCIHTVQKYRKQVYPIQFFLTRLWWMKFWCFRMKSVSCKHH